MLVMWIPKTAQELVEAISNGALPHEATAFEVKKQPPVAAKNLDMAVDVAAMSTDGGVIIYGVDEDRATDTFTPTPFTLAGFKERISEVVASNTREPVEFAVHELPLDGDPTQGFVAVVVPASLRAPHMVESKGQYHYYGRIPGGNRLLSQADVARCCTSAGSGSRMPPSRRSTRPSGTPRSPRCMAALISTSLLCRWSRIRASASEPWWGVATLYS